MEKEIYISKEGLKRLKKEYEILKALRDAKTKGEAPAILESEDINPEYLSFQEDLNQLESRMFDLEYIFKYGKLIKKPPKSKRNIVYPGAKVIVEVDDGSKDEFEIVGIFEAKPSLGRISNESPVGKSFLGKKKGDTVIISSPVKKIYKIKNIKYS